MTKVHVATVEGDGAGYDIKSYTPDGEQKFIEVKTTRGGEQTPFYVSSAEARFAAEHGHCYYLYRVFEFDEGTSSGKFFISKGDLCTNFSLEPLFPNAFLGVLMPEVELLSAPKLKRGRRFDWLYEQLVTTGRLESVLSKKLDMPDEFWLRLRSEKDHELRASLICLLTAAIAAQGTATISGDAAGGWFWLPPWPLWQPWATQGLESAAKKWP